MTAATRTRRTKTKAESQSRRKKKFPPEENVIQKTSTARLQKKLKEKILICTIVSFSLGMKRGKDSILIFSTEATSLHR